MLDRIAFERFGLLRHVSAACIVCCLAWLKGVFRRCSKDGLGCVWIVGHGQHSCGGYRGRAARIAARRSSERFFAIPADDLQSAGRRFLALMERPQSVGFSIGWIDPFVQLGPAFLDDRLVMLPSCVTNFAATLRGSDYLSPQVVPHVTLGKLAVGMGRVVGGASGLE